MRVRGSLALGFLIGISVVAWGAGLWLFEPERLPVPPLANLVLDDLTVIRPGLDRREHMRIVIREGRIASVRPIPTDGSPIDPTYAGMFVIPGLADMHVHYPPFWMPGEVDRWSRLFLEHGVTTVRILGDFDGRSLQLRDEIRAGKRFGPRILTCGSILDGDPPQWPIARVVKDAAEARAAVVDLAARGVDCIKVYSGLSDEALTAIHAAAHERGLPVVGHLPRRGTWAETRIDDIQHVCEPRCESFSRAAMHELVETAARHGIAHTPTLVVYEGLVKQADYARSVEEPAARMLPPVWRRVLWNPKAPWFAAPASEGEARERRASAERLFARVKEAVALMHARGVEIRAGTDAGYPFVVPGVSLLRELELLAEAGIGVEGALAVTSGAGSALSDGSAGLRAGAGVEIVVVRGDPTLGLDALASAALVVAQGRVRDLAAAKCSGWAGWIDVAALVVRDAASDTRYHAALRCFPTRDSQTRNTTHASETTSTVTMKAGLGSISAPSEGAQRPGPQSKIQMIALAAKTKRGRFPRIWLSQPIPARISIDQRAT